MTLLLLGCQSIFSMTLRIYDWSNNGLKINDIRPSWQNSFAIFDEQPDKGPFFLLCKCICPCQHIKPLITRFVRDEHKIFVIKIYVYKIQSHKSSKIYLKKKKIPQIHSHEPNQRFLWTEIQAYKINVCKNLILESQLFTERSHEVENWGPGLLKTQKRGNPNKSSARKSYIWCPLISLRNWWIRHLTSTRTHSESHYWI